MLELALEQISMAQVAADKSAALQLLADHLVADGLVALGIFKACKIASNRARPFWGRVLPSLTAPRRPVIRCTPPGCV